MDPLLMAGSWAAAILAVAGFGRLLWKTFVTAVEKVISDAIARVWTDMDEIEDRLTKLELSVQFVREQLDDLREMMRAHIQDG
jgi:F0F1-type ATP synthase membrane subunit b/b'